VDVDVAAESTQLARWNILVQAGTSMLSQANQSSQTALKLLQG
jgi:flagellin